MPKLTALRRNPDLNRNRGVWVIPTMHLPPPCLRASSETRIISVFLVCSGDLRPGLLQPELREKIISRFFQTQDVPLRLPFLLLLHDLR